MRKLNVYFDVNLQISIHLCSTNLKFRLLILRSRDSCSIKNGVFELLVAYFNVFITINVLIIHRYSDNLYVLLVHYAL